MARKMTSAALREELLDAWEKTKRGEMDVRMLFGCVAVVKTITQSAMADAAILNMKTTTADLAEYAGAIGAAPTPKLLEESIGLAPRCPGCERHRVPGGGLCERCAADEQRTLHS